MPLATRVLIGLLLGLFAGLFFGELVAFLGAVGHTFILLLQMTVLPYIAVSLMAGLGSLDYAGARVLALRAGSFIGLFWGIAVLVVLLIPLAFPDWKSASFFSSNLIDQGGDFNLFELYIPSNPIRSMAANIVPATVVFSVALGVALIGVSDKESLLGSLVNLREALARITNFVVGLAPYGVFAIVAEASGTLQLSDISGMRVYLAIYILMALLMGLWVLPGLVMTLTPYRYGDLIGRSRAALITAFATGSVFVVLPILAQRSKELLGEHLEDSEEAESFADVIVPASFNFPSAGKLLSLGFILFAGWLSGFPISPASYPDFAMMGVFSFFGSIYAAIPFLLDYFRMPSDVFQLFVVANSVVINRFAALVAAVHVLSLTLLSTSAMAGLLRVRLVPLARYVAITLIVLTAVPLGVRTLFEYLGHEYRQYDMFISREPLFDRGEWREIEPDEAPSAAPSASGGVTSAVDSSSDTPSREEAARPAGSTLDRIIARGTLRVGYLPNRLPFAFRNQAGTLVGLDVEMAHSLGAELGVAVEFMRVDKSNVAELLESASIDIVMSGVAVTTQSLRWVSFSKPYIDETLAFVVRDHDRDSYNSREALKELKAPKIAVPDTPYYVDKLRRYLPSAELVVVDSPRRFFRQQGREFDALLYTAESGSSWSLIYPEYTVAVPHPDVLSVPLAYAVARGDEEMIDLLGTWIELKKRDRTIGRLFDYWIEGKRPARKEPRWSVIRDVLGWVE